MKKSGAARVPQVYLFSDVRYLVLPSLNKGLLVILTTSCLFALAVKYTVYCSTAIWVAVIVPQPEAQPKKELVVAIVPRPETQPLKVHPETCQVYC